MRRRPDPRPRQPSLIAEIPHDERPRERLLRSGAQALSDAELVAILLKGGRPGASVLDLSRGLLFQAGGLRGLANSCAKSLRRSGVGEVKIATLLAAVEIACRMAAAAVPLQEPLSRAAEVGRYIDLRYGRSGQEVMGALYVCARHRLIGERELYRGTLHRSAVEPRAVLREGLLLGAAGLVLFHTHPSGDPAPARGPAVYAADGAGGGGRGDRDGRPPGGRRRRGVGEPQGARRVVTPWAAQAALAEVALQLVAIADRLQRIHDELPTAPNREAMWAHEVPRDVATEVYGTIEAVLVDEIRPAIEYLEAASRVTAEELRERFERDRGGSR